MPNLILRPDWHLPESRVTPERAYRNRRKFLRELGLSGGGLLAASGLLERDALAADARPVGGREVREGEAEFAGADGVGDVLDGAKLRLGRLQRGLDGLAPRHVHDAAERGDFVCG